MLTTNEAIYYAKQPMADPNIRARCEKLGKKANRQPFRVAVSDFLAGNNLPEKNRSLIIPGMSAPGAAGIGSVIHINALWSETIKAESWSVEVPPLEHFFRFYRLAP